MERVISKTMIDEQVNTLPSTQPPSVAIPPAISPQSLVSNVMKSIFNVT